MTSFETVAVASNNSNNSKYNTDDLKQLLLSCEPYMLTNINLLKCINNSDNLVNYSDVYKKTIINVTNQKPVNRNMDKLLKKNMKSEKDQKPEFAEIKEKDSLFWCFYIMKYGYDDYNMLNQHFLIEKNLKIESISKIREDKELLKKHKLKRSEIENELANDEKITLKGFLALCIYNKLNFKHSSRGKSSTGYWICKIYFFNFCNKIYF